MDATQFDDLLCSLVETPSRRGVVRGMVGLIASGPSPSLLGLADAAAKKRHKHKKKCKAGTNKCGKR